MTRAAFATAMVCAPLALALAACGTRVKADPTAEAPPPSIVERAPDSNVVKAGRTQQFPLVIAQPHISSPDLKVTGVVSPDISRNIPVISLASGRVVDIRVRIGDAVNKGQLLMRIQSADISQAFSDYRQALASQTLARAQLERARILYEKGATAQKDLEVVQDAAAKADVMVETTLTRLHVLGADANHPSAFVDITAPASGIITEQNVTAASGVKTLDNSPNLFTISDFSHVWIICDVYENDLPHVHPGEYAEIRVNAYPNQVLKGRIGNIGPVLDPAVRTAKVRLEVTNPGMLRLGMFVTATFHGLERARNAAVPATAVLHLHDRDWVYVPIGDGQFRRVEIVAGNMLPGNVQEILSGIQPGQEVVGNALVLQNTVE